MRVNERVTLGTTSDLEVRDVLVASSDVGVAAALGTSSDAEMRKALVASPDVVVAAVSWETISGMLVGTPKT